MKPPAPPVAEVSQWYVLNYFSPLSSRKGASAKDCVDSFNTRENTSLQLFCPSFVVYHEKNGQKKKVDKPLAFHYTFVRGELSDIKKLCSQANNFSFVLNKSGESRYAIVDDITMENFRKIALSYSNNVPFYSLEGVDLEDFDKVQIIEGDFPGLTGYYSSKKGSNKGRVILQITQNMGTVLYDVKAKYIKILEFSKNFKRAYDLIDAFIPRLYTSMRKFSTGSSLNEEEISALHSFCRRMSSVSLPNSKIDAKLQAILVAAFTILGNEAEAAEAAKRYDKKKQSVTSDAIKAFIELLRGVITKDASALKSGYGYLIKKEDKTTASLSQLREEYNYYLGKL